ncbi:MAG TPA: transcriptional regulator [Coriobacteriia bacterium]|nr:transcriptional regulator [Coriobacteriia bacterium]
MGRPISKKVLTANREIGEQLRTWRKLLNLTLAQVADRAGIARSTLQLIEKGDGGVSFQAVLSVARALGVLDDIVKATDPYETEFGRARADITLPKRVRP